VSVIADFNTDQTPVDTG